LRYAPIMSDHGLGGRDGTHDPGRLLYAAGRERLGVALADLFLPTSQRLTEWQRVTMAGLLERLIRSIEDGIRNRLAMRFGEGDYPEANAALTAAHVEIALPILEGSSALRDPELVNFLLRRLEEHRLHRLTGAAGGSDGLIAELARDKDPAVSSAAMAVFVASSRRLDRFQDPVIAKPELPQPVAHRLCWTIAAALRSYLIERHGIAVDAVDRAVGEAVRLQLRAEGETEGLEARSLELVRNLDAAGRLDGSLIVRSLTEGALPILLACLSLKCDIPVDAAWEIVSEPSGRGAPLLLRSAGLDREQAATLLFALEPDRDERSGKGVARQVDVFTTTARRDAQSTIRFWRLDPAYRAAIVAVTKSAGGTAGL
jgi:hypothetical protein